MKARTNNTISVVSTPVKEYELENKIRNFDCYGIFDIVVCQPNLPLASSLDASQHKRCISSTPCTFKSMILLLKDFKKKTEC